MTDETSKAAYMGTTSKTTTMADGSLRVQIDLSPADAIAAFAAFGPPGSAVALARLTDEAAVEENRPGKMTKGPYGNYARDLIQSGFFRSPQVWAAVGTDKEYLEWVKRQPSAISGDFSEYHDDGEAYCIPAHVRKVEHGSGTAIKPPYSAIPLTNKEHQLAHQKGDSVIGDEEWWDKQRIKYVQNWAQATLKENLGFDSWTQISPQTLIDYAEKHDLINYLPGSIRRQEYDETQNENASSAAG